MDESTSLRCCYREAEKKRVSLEQFFNSNSDSFQENLTSAITKYEDCVKIASDIALFSSNETLEDISSGDLQYLLSHFYIAELLLRSNTGERKNVLQKSREQYDSFLKLLDSYDILSREDARLYEYYKERPNTFSTASTTDAAARRQTKINRFREEKALKQKLEYLRQNPSALEMDDSMLRDLHLTNIAFCLHQTFQSLESIAQEIEILSLAPPKLPTANHEVLSDARLRNGGVSGDGYSERLDPSISQLLANGGTGPILSKDGRPLRPFTLLDTRQRLQEGVFRPDHNLPTMTIDEYLEEEKRRGGIIEGGGAQSGMKPQVNEDDLDRADMETLKARAWDDYKDDNPKGAGNTMNMG